MCILGTSSLFDPVFIISTGGKETPTQVFFCEILKNFKNPFFLQNTSDDCFCIESILTRE